MILLYMLSHALPVLQLYDQLDASVVDAAVQLYCSCVRTACDVHDGYEVHVPLAHGSMHAPAHRGARHGGAAAVKAGSRSTGADAAAAASGAAVPRLETSAAEAAEADAKVVAAQGSEEGAAPGSRSMPHVKKPPALQVDLEGGSSAAAFACSQPSKHHLQQQQAQDAGDSCVLAFHSANDAVGACSNAHATLYCGCRDMDAPLV